MGKKVKLKVKKGKLKVKLKSGDAALPLSEANLRWLLASGMALPGPLWSCWRPAGRRAARA